MGDISAPCNGVSRSLPSPADPNGLNNDCKDSGFSSHAGRDISTISMMDTLHGDPVKRPLQQDIAAASGLNVSTTSSQGSIRSRDGVAEDSKSLEPAWKYRPRSLPHGEQSSGQMQEELVNGTGSHAPPEGSAATLESPTTGDQGRKILDTATSIQQNGVIPSPHSDYQLRSPSQRAMNGDRKGGQSSLSSDQPFGLSGPSQESESTLNQWPGEGESSPSRNNQEKDRDRVPKLSPAQIHELTSSPQSIPYRTAEEQSRRVVSEGSQSAAPPEIAEMGSYTLNDAKGSPERTPKFRPDKAPTVDFVSGLVTRPSTSSRSRPPAPRAASTPNSMRRQTLPSNERLAQTWASRSKQDRPTVGKESDGRYLNPSAMKAEPAIPSPMPPSIPLPPLSVPTYLQLELASGRPSPLYIHRSAMSDFPYESSRVKLERLMNFLILPPALEQVLWFGILACLDSWLYSFTILPLRFIKALYMLIESWMTNLGVELRYLSGFIIKGVGRVWRRRTKHSPDGTQEQTNEPELETRARAASTKIEQVPVERDFKRASETRRRHRSDVQHRHQHRRQKSIPSALLPDDKADILKGLLMITTCAVLMYFDASRMYHWIRGQAAIKLYVIYNVLEVSDRLFAAIGQDVLECLFSREALERRPDGRSKVFRPFGLFLLALAYTVIHATALFFQVMTLNVAVNSYSNALITLLLSNQFVEIKSTVFKKFEKENLFQLTCADVVERFQLWLMLTIIASRNIVETGAFSFFGTLGASFGGTYASTATNSTPLSTPPRTATSILPQSFTIVPSSIVASFSHVNSFLPTLAQVLGPFLVVLGSEMLVDWLKHAYINKFNNTRPAIYGRFLDILAKDYYTNAFGDQNLTRRLGLPVIPLSCLFFRVSVQTYQMFLAALLPQHPSSTAVSSTSLSSIHSHYAPLPIPSPPPLTIRTILPVSAAHAGSFFRQMLANAMPTPAQAVYLFTIVLLLTGFVLLLIFKLLLGMVLLAFARTRYKAMKHREAETSSTSSSSTHPPTENGGPPRGREFAVEGSKRVGGWGVVEVNEDQRRWIYVDDPEGLRRLKTKEEKDKNTKEETNLDHVQRYEMVAKRIW